MEFTRIRLALAIEERREALRQYLEGAWSDHKPGDANEFMDGWADGYYAGVECMTCEWDGIEQCPEHGDPVWW